MILFWHWEGIKKLTELSVVHRRHRPRQIMYWISQWRPRRQVPGGTANGTEILGLVLTKVTGALYDSRSQNWGSVGSSWSFTETVPVWDHQKVAALPPRPHRGCGIAIIPSQSVATIMYCHVLSRLFVIKLILIHWRVTTDSSRWCHLCAFIVLVLFWLSSGCGCW